MKFAANRVYYIYNMGNNFEDIFFSAENESFFQEKINKYILPFAQVLQCSLAKNQFHILIKTRDGVDSKELSKNIGIMLRSYTRAINKQQNRIGSLFRCSTKSFSNLGEIPQHLRQKIKPYIKKIFPGESIDFEQTVGSFLRALNELVRQKDPENCNKELLEIFRHPLKRKGLMRRANKPWHGRFGQPFNLAKGKKIIRDP